MGHRGQGGGREVSQSRRFLPNEGSTEISGRTLRCESGHGGWRDILGCRQEVQNVVD